MLAYGADVGFSALGDDSHSEASLALDGATDLFVGVNKMVHGFPALVLYQFSMSTS